MRPWRRTTATPCISILTAVRDGLPYLEEAIASIRAQTLGDWEWVLVDDGSTDGSAARLADWAHRDPRLRLLRRPATGLVAALNAGLARCRAALVARMDADDIARPERLALQRAALVAGSGETVVDGRVELFGGRRNQGMQRYVRWLNEHHDHASIAADLFVESPIVHPATCYQRDAVLAAGAYRAGDFPEDYDLWLRLHARGHRFRKLSPTVLHWRDHRSRLTRTDRRYRRAAFTALKQRALWALEGEQLASGPLVLWGAARGTRSWRQWLRHHALRPAYVIDANPRRQGQRILDAPVVPAGELRRRRWGYLLVTVSSPDSRADIRERLSAWKLLDGAPRTVRFV